jgi:thioredoxin 1
VDRFAEIKMAGANTQTFDESSFEAEVLRSDVPVLVDFWAEWCGPCKMLTPIIDELATEYQGKAKVGKVDLQESNSLATRYGIQAIPTVICFVNGKPVQRLIGVRHKREYASVLDAQIGG